ncbi:hypothetical protein NF212_04940 [Parasalinivibrio latis]|uniref:hypothetical protein n=1 Tax=Parasalinivibrio latis TaxID=2952610 RepID=UPI0030E50C8F
MTTPNPYLVTRRLRLVSEAQADNLEKLASLDSVTNVTCNKKTLTIRYSANMANLENLLSLAGLTMAGGLLNRLRYKLYLFSDNNLRDGAIHKPHCCNKIH